MTQEQLVKIGEELHLTETFEIDGSDRFWIDDLKPCLEVLRDKVDSKDTKVLEMFSQLIRLADLCVGFTEIDQEAFLTLCNERDKQLLEIDTLHLRCGDKRVCDKCGTPIIVSDCMQVCEKCENERIEKDKIDVRKDDYCPPIYNWHWEEKENK